MSITYNITYHSDTFDGITSFHKEGSDLIAYSIPRNKMDQIEDIIYSEKYGIYYLFNRKNRNGKIRLHIGIAIDGFESLQYERLSWDRAFFFFVDGNVLTLDMLNALNKLSVDQAESSSYYKVESTVSEKIKQEDISSVKDIYQEIEFILQTQGYPFEKKQSELLFIFRNGKRIASGRYLGDSFEVLEGSNILMSKASRSPSIDERKKKDLENGDIVKEDDKYILKTTKSFTTATAAAMYVLGSGLNGWLVWKDEKGRSMRELYR